MTLPVVGDKVEICLWRKVHGSGSAWGYEKQEIWFPATVVACNDEWLEWIIDRSSAHRIGGKTDVGTLGVFWRTA